MLWLINFHDLDLKCRTNPVYSRCWLCRWCCQSIFTSSKMILAIIHSIILFVPGGRRRLWVFRKASTGETEILFRICWYKNVCCLGDPVFRAELLRGVWQRWRHDVRRRNPHVLLPGECGEIDGEDKDDENDDENDDSDCDNEDGDGNVSRSICVRKPYLPLVI